MMYWYRDWKRRRTLKRHTLAADLWHRALSSVPHGNQLNSDEQGRLRELTILFIHEKSIEGVGGMTVTDEHRVIVAAQAALLILNLDIDWYDDWRSVLVYPAGFEVEQEFVDEFGLVHTVREARDGEAWERGPVIVAWDAVVSGFPVLLHEFAHKLDARNGATNGMPPLHHHMSTQDWTAAFSSAWDDFCVRCDNGDVLPFDDYAAESPAEFFSVTSELFFTEPNVLYQAYPRVYDQLKLFYRQDALSRVESHG